MRNLLTAGKWSLFLIGLVIAAIFFSKARKALEELFNGLFSRVDLEN